jgi:hypothetical protein
MDATGLIDRWNGKAAQAGTAAQFDRICSAYARTDRLGVDPDEPADPHADEPSPSEIDSGEQAHADERAERQVVRIWHDEDGLMHLEAVLNPEVGSQIEAALASVMAHLDDLAPSDDAGHHLDEDGSAEVGNGSGGPAGPPVRRRATRLDGLVELAPVLPHGDLGGTQHRTPTPGRVGRRRRAHSSG